MAIARITAGSIFATRIFFFHIRLIPTQKIRMEPIIDTFDNASGIIRGRTRRASKVTSPWKIATGIAENRQPFPIAAVITIMMIRSRIALVTRMEISPDIPSSIAPTIAIAPIHTVSDA